MLVTVFAERVDRQAPVRNAGHWMPETVCVADRLAAHEAGSDDDQKRILADSRTGLRGGVLLQVLRGGHQRIPRPLDALQSLLVSRSHRILPWDADEPDPISYAISSI
jgi:hypothetical protein